MKMINRRKEGVVHITFHEDFQPISLNDHTITLNPVSSLEKTFLILNEPKQKLIGNKGKPMGVNMHCVYLCECEC